MIEELKESGIPIFIDEKKERLEMKDGFFAEDVQYKTAGELAHVFSNEPKDYGEIIFTFYRNVHSKNHSSVFAEHNLRYDITFIRQGLVGQEYKKTTGHYHKMLPEKKYSHAELYEVLFGKALFIIQPLISMLQDNSKIENTEIIYIIHEAGGRIAIPPNCAHCTVNIGDSDLIFSNLVLDSGRNEYDYIKQNHGMGIYIKENEKEVMVSKNPYYDLSNIEIYEGQSIWESDLGIHSEMAVYPSFIKNPCQYKWLSDPDSYIDIIQKTIKKKNLISYFPMQLTI